MLTAAFHLLFSSLDEVEHTGVAIELGIHGYRLHQHAHRTVRAFVGTSVVYSVEQHLLVVIVFCQQISVGGCKERTSENAVRLAESIDRVDDYVQCAC